MSLRRSIVTVNWSKQTVVFTSAPKAREENMTKSESMVGLDRGGVVPIASRGGR